VNYQQKVFFFVCVCVCVFFKVNYSFNFQKKYSFCVSQNFVFHRSFEMLSGVVNDVRVKILGRIKIISTCFSLLNDIIC